MKKSWLLSARVLFPFTALVMGALMWLLPSSRACATTMCYDCSCIFQEYATTSQKISDEHSDSRDHFGTADPIPSQPSEDSGSGELGDHQNWLTETFKTTVFPALTGIAKQMTIVMMQQAVMIGGFIDASVQLDAQLALQKKTAETIRDYHPSSGLCALGTGVRGLAAATGNGEMTQAALNAELMNRQMGSRNTLGTEGYGEDRRSRFEDFRGRYCNRFDNNPLAGEVLTGFGAICKASVTGQGVGRNVNYAGVVMEQKSLQLDFSDSSLTDDERDVLALSRNLYAHETFDHLSPASVRLLDNIDEYLETRAVAAKRGVAANSFFSLAAMRTMGDPLAQSQRNADDVKYIDVALQQLGVPKDELDYYLGDRPSYLAQMEVLAKKIYQNPNFYSDLYDSPANVKRRSVAMQGIGLMLDRDIYNSQLRSEAILSTLLELKLIRQQDLVQAEINKRKQTGP